MRSVVIIWLFFLVLNPHANALCVKNKKANLRAKATSKSTKTWEVYRYMPLRQIGKKGNWYEVKDFEGDEHWIYRKLVTKKYFCAVIKVKKANGRSGPSTRYRKVIKLDKYDTFRFVKASKNKKWAKLKNTYNETFWVYRDLIWIN